MRKRRLLWTITILIMWILSLVMVESAARKQRIGYQMQKLHKINKKAMEKNLRLKCEITSLHDLDKAEIYASKNDFKPVGPHSVEIVLEENAK